MRLLRPVIQNQSAAGDLFPVLRVIAALLPLTILFDSGSAWADVVAASKGFTGYSEATVEKTNVLVDVFSYVCYIMGAVLTALGISEMRRVADGSGGGSLAWRHPLTKLGFGGMFLALPFFTLVLQATMTGTAMPTYGFALIKSFTFGTTYATKATGISGMIANIVSNGTAFMSISAFLAYLIGVFFTVRGLQLIKAHIENPGNAPLPEGIKRLAVGGALFSFPLITHIIRETMGVDYATSGLITNTGFNKIPGVAGSLDGMMISFVDDVANAAYFGIEAFCYIAGIVMILFAMQRLVRTAQDGPRGPLTFGTISMFIVAGVLLSFPQFLAVLNNSILGTDGALTRVSFMSIAGADKIQIDNAKNVFSAVLAFMAVVGFLSVVRGLFMLRTLAEGGQATMMQVAVHLVAGSIAINLGAFINAIQTSLGLDPAKFALTFG